MSLKRQIAHTILDLAGLMMGFIIGLLFTVHACAAPPPTREELVTALRNAEQLRASYRIVTRTVVDYDVPQYGRNFVERNLRLTDGKGRLQLRQWTQHPPVTEDSKWMETLDTWNGREQRSKQYPDSQPNVTDGLVIDSRAPEHQRYYDHIESILGCCIEYPISDRFPALSPSQAIADSKTSVTIQSALRDGREVVQVRIAGPWSGEGNTYIFEYDPARQWLPLFQQQRIYTTLDGRSGDKPGIIEEFHTREVQQVDGVWMPKVVDFVDMQSASGRRGDDNLVKSPSVITFEKVEMNPEVTDADFYISPEGLPNGAFITDSRIGVSYRLGEHFIYSDGVLHDVGQTLDREYSPSEVKTMLASSTPMVDPNLKTLKSVSTGSFRWDYLAGGLGILAIGGFFFLRRRAAQGG